MAWKKKRKRETKAGEDVFCFGSFTTERQAKKGEGEDVRTISE